MATTTSLSPPRRSADVSPINPASRINLQSLADKLGLARSTISRALRDDPLIAADTRRRVKEAAQKLGYRSNPYVSVLMSRVREGSAPAHAPIIAFLNPQASRHGSRSLTPMRAVIESAGARARELGFELLEFWLAEPGMTPERLADILVTRGIRAIIVGSPGHPTELVPFETKGFAAVGIDLDRGRRILHRATSDYLENTRQALRAMRAQGYRRIGLSIDEVTMANLQNLPRMAFLDFEEALPRADRTGYWMGAWNDLAGFARWLADVKPDGVVTANISRQIWFQSLGLRIPQDIGVTNLDPDIVPFPLSGIDGRFDVVGRNAMDLLVAQIHHNEFEPPTDPMHVMTAGVWRAGASTVDRNGQPTIDPYDDIRIGICHAVAQGNSDDVRAFRRRFCDRFYSNPFRLAAEAAPQAWRCLPLTAAANTPLHSPLRAPAFTTKDLFGLKAGRSTIRGVPFELPISKPSGPATVITLNTDEDRASRKTSPIVRRVPVNAKVRALYFFHTAFFVWTPAPGVRYRLVFDDGSSHLVDLLPFWPPTNGAEVAAFQDSWRALPQFESETAKPVFVISESSPLDFDGYFYVYELRNPHPGLTVHSIELSSQPEGSASILIAGITALLDG